jgi:hypothetical protein
VTTRVYVCFAKQTHGSLHPARTRAPFLFLIPFLSFLAAVVATACRLRIAARTSRLGIIAPPPTYRRQRRPPPPPYDATGGSLLCSSKGYRIHGGAGPKRSEPTVVLWVLGAQAQAMVVVILGSSVTLAEIHHSHGGGDR